MYDFLVYAYSMLTLHEPLPELFTRSRVVVFDFSQIDNLTPASANMELYFKTFLKEGRNPRQPESRQLFNNRFLSRSGKRYLIGRYGEDRIAMLADTPAGKEGRTIHLAIDIFSKDLEPVYAPCDGRVVVSGYEEGYGQFGNYLIFQPKNANFYLFFGHLASDRIDTGTVKSGTLLAHIGDFHNNENGGWSRHLHLQVLKELPPAGTTPPGYSTRKNFKANSALYPDPMSYFPEWKLK